MVVIEGTNYKDWVLQYRVADTLTGICGSGMEFFDSREQAEKWISSHGYGITSYVIAPTEEVKDELL